MVSGADKVPEFNCRVKDLVRHLKSRQRAKKPLENKRNFLLKESKFGKLDQKVWILNGRFFTDFGICGADLDLPERDGATAR